MCKDKLLLGKKVITGFDWHGGFCILLYVSYVNPITKLKRRTVSLSLSAALRDSCLVSILDTSPQTMRGENVPLPNSYPLDRRMNIDNR